MLNIKLISDSVYLGDEIRRALESGRYNYFRIAVAFARNSGVVTIQRSLQEFINNGGEISIIAGIDQKVTSYQSLVNLLAFTEKGRRLYIHHTDEYNETFHPKMYIFGKNPIEKIIVGSSNMTKGGFYNNVEANIGIDFSNITSESKNICEFRCAVEEFWNNLICDKNTVPTSTEEREAKKFLIDLLVDDLLENETNFTSYRNAVNSAMQGKIRTIHHFGKTTRKNKYEENALSDFSQSIKDDTEIPKQTYAMTLSRFDTSERSLDPVILIPLKALRENSRFWKFPDNYTHSEGKYLQYYVDIVEKDSGFPKKSVARIYYYDEKKEFRFQCEYIKRNGKPQDIMEIENTSCGYEVRLIRQGTAQYESKINKLTQSVSSQKKYGYFISESES